MIEWRKKSCFQKKKIDEFEKEKIKDKKRNFREIVIKGSRYKAEIRVVYKKEVQMLLRN